jgi:hypothetical protein
MLKWMIISDFQSEQAPLWLADAHVTNGRIYRLSCALTLLPVKLGCTATTVYETAGHALFAVDEHAGVFFCIGLSPAI